MNLKTRAARRRDSRSETRVDWRERLRKSVAMFALSALALAGLSALTAAPASAEEEPPATVVCIDPQVLDEATGTCVDPVVVDEGESEGEGAVETDLVCESPKVLDEAGTACVDPPTNTGSDPPADVLTCDEGSVLNEAGDACVLAEVPPVGDSLNSLKSTDEVVALVDNPKKIQFCHRTAADGNPYVYLDTSIQAFFNSGHISHTGPIYPDEVDGFWGDIYPPNQYDLDGQNWTTEGQAIFDNDCNIPGTPPTTPGLNISVDECVLYGGRDVFVEATNLQADKFYQLFLGATLMDSGWGDEEIAFETVLDAGTYETTVKMFPDDKAKDKDLISSLTVDFVVEDCADLDLEVTPDACSLGDDGVASLMLSGLIAGEEYSWFVSGDGGYYEEGTFEATGETETVTLSDLPPDHYYAYVEWVSGGVTVLEQREPEVWAEDWFTVDPCPPDVTVTVIECPAMGGTGSALVSITGLVDGVEYDVWVTAQGDEFGPVFGSVHTVVGDSDGKAHVNFTSLPAPGSYTAWVEGEYVWPHEVDLLSYVENGDHEMVTLKDHVDFALKACPSALPATGAEPMLGLTLSLLLGGAGALTLVAGRLRRMLG